MFIRKNEVIDSNRYEEHRQALVHLFKTTPGCIQKGDFTLTSGNKSKYYIDAKKVTLQGRGLYLISYCFLYLMRNLIGVPNSVGGVTMGADPLVAGCVSHSEEWFEAPIDGFIIRKDAKGHGTGRRVEGCVEKWHRYVILEDVTTTGKSVAEAIDVLKGEKMSMCSAVICVVDRQEGGSDAIRKFAHFYSLMNANDLGI
jgi:orotate phosphoribosyltransferase